VAANLTEDELIQVGVSTNIPPSLMSKAIPMPCEINLPDLLNSE